MANPTAKLQTRLGELRLRVDASLAALEAIKARTSTVLAATEAFRALSAECRALSRALFDPQLNDDAARREATARRLQPLVERFEALQQSYAGVAPRGPHTKKPWWHLFS